MGLIIENMELQPQLTAFENLEELNKINHYATTSDIQDALRKINLQSNEKVKKFSLGMKQKLNIAQAMENAINGRFKKEELLYYNCHT